MREQQLKYRPVAMCNTGQELHYSWIYQEPDFSDWLQHPYQRVLQFAAQRDLLRGMEQGKIAPDAPFTNAMAAAVLHRLSPTAESVTVNDDDNWYSADWQWAQKCQLFDADAVPETVMCGQDFQRCLWLMVAPEEDVPLPRFFAQKQLSRGEAAVVLQDFITQTV